MPAKEPANDPLAGHPVYAQVRFINSGSFGYVVLARNKQTGEEVAIKFVEVSTEKDVKHRYGLGSIVSISETRKLIGNVARRLTPLAGTKPSAVKERL